MKRPHFLIALALFLVAGILPLAVMFLRITTQDLLQGCQQTAAKISSEYELSGLEKT